MAVLTRAHVLTPLTERGSIAKIRDSNSVVDIFILVPVMVNIFERKRIVVKNGTRNLIVKVKCKKQTGVDR